MKKNSRFVKVAVSAGLIVCSGAAVLGLTSFASAKVGSANQAVVQVDDTTNATDSTVAGSDTTIAGSDATAPSADKPPFDTARPSPIAVAAKALGMTETELAAELQSGKSIADVAKTKNVELADVKAALLKDIKAHLDDEVAAGEHTQAEADAKYEEMKTRVDQMLTQAGLPPMGRHGGKGGHGDMGGHGAPKFATDALAKVLNLSTDELNTALKSGQSLADIAKAQKVDIADVKAVLVKDFTAHLNDEVATGEHTQAEADQKLADFTSRLDDMVNGVRPAGDRGPGGHGGPGHGGPGHHDGQDPMGGDQNDTQGTSASA